MTKLNSAYWQNRYETQSTGWDVGSITAPLKTYLDQIEDKSIRILIPGGGNSYEFEYLITHGFTNVNVLDFAQQPLLNIQNRLPEVNPKQLIHADFFEHKATYDLIIEQTFYCALDPSLRDQYVQHMHGLLAKGGKLIGLLFQFPLTESGPPFGGSKEEYILRFSPYFNIKTLETAYNSIPPRQGNELFFIFIKK
ncbi:class I SAM-dependent methyltransferase [Flavobacterium stagni]|uniref:SAM-dependent methyltransferase n=1 Tax=Flavobacterium stagni TaxID=2506421 RepID=A0A4Q1K8A0_9FLAO|nr:SAM-dependent methyltransferase [Flavobacterium stagni]RXR22529.1 SAM-dependent methyltransferase [Flavobacterium stagni]